MLRHLIRGRSAVLLAALLFATVSNALRAHEIPTDVRIQAFMKAEGQRLRLLVRAPVAAMNDVAWPTDAANVVLNLESADLPVAMQEGARDFIASRIEIYEGNMRLGEPRIAAVRVSMPSDTSFDGYDNALAHLAGPPLPPETQLARGQALLDVLLEYDITSDQSLFSIDPRFQILGLRSTTILRFFTPSGAERAFTFHEDPGLVRLDPRWHQAAARFVSSGFDHILDGIDHLLFLFCLVIPFRRLTGLLPIVTSFTVAHSITLIAAAYGITPDVLWFPPLVETLIALSILYMALENIVVQTPRRRWILTFAFGLVHGFGFSFALTETLQFAGEHLLTSLLAFNVGVEFGQIAVLLVVLPILAVVFRYVVAERMGTIILSALIAHTAWHWMIERGGQLALYQYEMPVLDAAFFAALTRWLIVMVIAAAAAWLISITMGSWLKEQEKAQ